MYDDSAATAYAQLAPFYDRFTGDHNYDDWLDTVLAVAGEQGFVGGRVLDVACGTGNSLLPLIQRGYEVTGCDLSAEMLAIAAMKVGAEVSLFCADLRALPETGRYDLVICLGDVLNYLLEPDDLEAAVGSLAAALAPGGVCVADVNTIGAYATVFASDRVVAADEDCFLVWHGTGPQTVRPGSRVEVIVEAFTRESDLWRRVSSSHVHRAHADKEIRRAMHAAGLRCDGVYGTAPDGRLDNAVDETRHTKRLYVASLDAQTKKKGGADASHHEARVAGRAGGGLQQGQLAGMIPPGATAPGGLPESTSGVRI